MTARPGLVVLDTNILVHLVRGKAPGRHLDSTYELSSAAVRPLISVTTVGECLSLAKQFGWGSEKEKVLLDLLKQLVVVDINDSSVLDAYADIDFASRKNGNTMGKNDLWIAAVAVAANGWLLTTDKDFLPLDPDFLPVEWVNPQALPA
ncbi:type II toxin-antitoxin system VapC family toxin [Enhygromyxa salina]|uniref:tRNA(fMet)-specific endonuclease VapC n=1 Tax=Enhygromyxa salina TaxID=215803 RepID=A0A2S9XPY9_9BACT|nr:type II toxin-antitoxin system VapC family toxin [Enhygromyxa salina]PRP94761.1 tRNA(fMet)-specific endonuclease VapC [Enhygromyxa salina]